jgi:putative transposase
MALNPVRAGLAERPEAYRWSSALAHLSGKDDALVKVEGLLDIVGDWRGFLSNAVPDHALRRIRRHERTGRPLGDADFIANLEKTLDRILRYRKPGPKRKVENQ